MLRHSSDSEPGYTRKQQGRYWAYFDEDGKRITDRDDDRPAERDRASPGL